jgi:hypothetical protein
LPTETLVAHSVKAANWRNEELEAIVQYIALYKPSFDDDHWPATRDGAFREQCPKAVHQYSGQPLRTGTLYIVYRVDWNLVNMVTNRQKNLAVLTYGDYINNVNLLGEVLHHMLKLRIVY